MFSHFRRSIYKGTPNFIHFNLALSLFIGLIVFVSGVETTKDNKVLLTIDMYSNNQQVNVLFSLDYLYSSCSCFTLFLLGCICMDAV